MTCVLLGSVLDGAGPWDPYYYVTSIGRALIFAMAFQGFLHLRDAYDFRVRLSQASFLIRVSQAIGLACLAVSILYFALPDLRIGAGSLVFIFMRAAILLAVWHVLLRLYFKHFTRRSNVLILGTGRLARTLATEIVRRPELGLVVCGFLDDDPSLLGVSIVNPKVIGLNRDLKRIVSERPVEKIVVELQDRRGRLPTKELLDRKSVV